jgi:hypothetical protein
MKAKHYRGESVKPKRKPKKKVVGLAEKAEKRKQRTESRLAQRTGISARDRELKKMYNQLKKYFMPKTDKDREYEKDKEFWRNFKPKVSPGALLKKGGKVK